MKKNFQKTAMLIAPFIVFALGCNFIPQVNDFFIQAQIMSVSLNMPLEKLNENIASNTEEKTTNDTKAASKDDEAKETSNRVEYDITKTPDDILKLKAKAEKEIEKQEKKGNISEQPYVGGGKIVEKNNIKIQTKIPEDFYRLNIENLLSQKADLSIADKNKPAVLIYHSHTTEAYQSLDVGYYTTSFMQRRDDTAQNMVRVGDEITEVLRKNGFNVIHDAEIYDKDYNAAYGLSDKSVKKYLEKYPSIDVTIDVHRDCIEFNDGTKIKTVHEVQGKKAAKMMIISGCQYGQINNFPDWEYNLRFALALQQKAEEMYPELMRPILFSARRYNMFETHNSILLEVGTDGNTLEEACYSGRLIGEVLSEFLNSYVKK